MLPPLPPALRLRTHRRRPRPHHGAATAQILIHRIIDNPLLPQVAKQVGINPRGVGACRGGQVEPLARAVVRRDVVHANVPGAAAVGVLPAPVAARHGAGDFARWQVAEEVREHVRFPFALVVGGDVAAAEEAEGAVVEDCGGGGGSWRDEKQPVAPFLQRAVGRPLARLERVDGAFGHGG